MLLMLAFDHRDAFEAVHDDAGSIPAAKAVVYEGLARAVEARPELRGRAGLFVDEQYGAEVARRAKTDGLVLAMPIERSGVPELELQYGDAWTGHVDDFRPDVGKVLLRMRPDDDPGRTERQVGVLRRIAEGLASRPTRFLLELVAGGPAGEERTESALAVMEGLQNAGVEPDIWKLEAAPDAEGFGRLAAQARSDGRDAVECILLGGGADPEAVARSLRLAAGTDGFTGFAVGRTIWAPAVEGLAAGAVEREDAVASVARAYGACVDAFLAPIPAP